MGIFRSKGLPKTGKSSEEDGFKSLQENARNMQIPRFQKWLHSIGFRTNPFTFEIMTGTLVGYHEQTSAILDAVLSGSKVVLVLGPTGSGKTTVLRWVAQSISDIRKIIYLPKPPEKPQEFLDIINPRFESGFFRKNRAQSIYDLPEFMSRQSAGKALEGVTMMCDEAHEASDEILMWMRALNDNVDRMNIVLAALPRFERDLGERLETLRKRISTRVNILSLTKEETKELIEKRQRAAGGRNIFSGDAADYIHEQSAGFPREILRLCDSALRKACETGAAGITRSLIEEPVIMQERIETESVPDKQRMLLEALVNPATAAQLAERFSVHYKSRQHALRALNNMLHRLMQTGLIIREPYEKTYVYRLSSKAKTPFVTR